MRRGRLLQTEEKLVEVVARPPVDLADEVARLQPRVPHRHAALVHAAHRPPPRVPLHIHAQPPPGSTRQRSPSSIVWGGRRRAVRAAASLHAAEAALRGAEERPGPSDGPG